MNKNNRIALFCTTAAGLFAATNLCSAALITWEDTHTGSPLALLREKWGKNDKKYDLSYHNTWNILDAGFNPATDTIDAITVWFAFADDRPGKYEGAEINAGGDIEEHVDISLGGTKIWDNLEVDGRHPSATYAYYSMVLDPLAHFAVFADLSSDGKLGYSVVLQDLYPNYDRKGKLLDSGKYREDTYLKAAKIQAFSKPPTPRTNRVPDSGSTALVFGLGLLGLGSVRRFLIKA